MVVADFPDLAPRPFFDVVSAILVVLVTGFIHALPIIAQVLGVVVLILTVWEKPTVQAIWARLRNRFNRGGDDATGG